MRCCVMKEKQLNAASFCSAFGEITLSAHTNINLQILPKFKSSVKRAVWSLEI